MGVGGSEVSGALFERTVGARYVLLKGLGAKCLFTSVTYTKPNGGSKLNSPVLACLLSSSVSVLRLLGSLVRSWEQWGSIRCSEGHGTVLFSCCSEKVLACESLILAHGFKELGG